jgi:hypothetical protein
LTWWTRNEAVEGNENNGISGQTDIEIKEGKFKHFVFQTT